VVLVHIIRMVKQKRELETCKGELQPYYCMHKEYGQMQSIHICGPMPSEQLMIAGITHQPMNKIHPQCQDSVQQAGYHLYRTNIILDAQLMS
jgi:hypothetical protein